MDQWPAVWAWCALMPVLRSQLVLFLMVQSLRQVAWVFAGTQLHVSCHINAQENIHWGNAGGQRVLPKRFFNGSVIKCIKIHQQTTSLSMLENAVWLLTALFLWGYSYKAGYEMLPALVVINGWKWPQSSLLFWGQKNKGLSEVTVCEEMWNVCQAGSAFPPTSSTHRRHWCCLKMVLSLARGCSFLKTPTTDLAVNSVGVKPN